MNKKVGRMLSLSKHEASPFDRLRVKPIRLAIACTLALALAGCGTKTELLKPDGKPTPRDERDPSQPPSPISR